MLLPLVFGSAIVLFGVVLVSTGGYIGGTYLPGLAGFPNCSSDHSSSNNSTPSSCTGFAGYGGFGVGTFVVIFGLGILGTAARMALYSPSPTVPAAMLPPGFFPPMGVQGMAGMAAPGNAPLAGNVRYCPECGRVNAFDASFCQQCGSPMPPRLSPTPPKGPGN
ncbi:MAG: hypothetical protein L3K07_05895 [Thermoplasmata archaeon]|nr:hypothetical protein [Thermoplasmata archaeon]